MNDELRAMTKNQRSFDRPVMMSSEMPSAKYSCSGSPLILANGSTAIDGRLAVDDSAATVDLNVAGGALPARKTR
jgi:hypothetical protein